MRDISKFLINQGTHTPIADALKISRVLDSIASSEQSTIDEKHILELFYVFATEEPYILPEDATLKFIDWFNETKIEKFINEVLSDDEYHLFGKEWQDLKN